MEENLKENTKDDEIDLNELYLTLKRRKFIILVTMLIFLIGGTAYAFLSKSVYKYAYYLKLPYAVSVGNKQLLISPALLKIYLKNIRHNKKYSTQLNSLANVSIKPLAHNNGLIGVYIEANNRNKIKPLSRFIYNYLNNMPALKYIVGKTKASLAIKLKYIQNDIDKDNVTLGVLRSDIVKGNIKIIGFNPVRIGNSLTKLKIKYTHYKNSLDALNGRAIKIIYMPPVPARPVKPKKPLIIAVSLISGLFIGIFAAFFVEWRKKNSASGQ